MKRKYCLGLALLLLCILVDAREDTVITVGGPVEASRMGTALIHEHILVDFIGAESTGYHRWDREAVVRKVLPYLLEAKDRGVETFFEMTPMYLGRDVRLLARLADESGLQIVTNTGYYGARDNKFIPESAWSESAEEIAKRWIDEFSNGIEGTGIRPGFIKIAVDRDTRLSEMHRKIVTAAAIAHRETGLTIVSHTGPDGPAFAQMELLKSLSVSPFGMGVDACPKRHLRRLLESGTGRGMDIDRQYFPPATEGQPRKESYRLVCGYPKKAEEE